MHYVCAGEFVYNIDFEKHAVNRRGQDSHHMEHGPNFLTHLRIGRTLAAQFLVFLQELLAHD